MTVLNELDRLHLVMDAIDRLPQTADRSTTLKRTSTRMARTCQKSATGSGIQEQMDRVEGIANLPQMVNTDCKAGAFARFNEARRL